MVIAIVLWQIVFSSQTTRRTPRRLYSLCHHPALVGYFVTNLASLDPFAEADEDTGETRQSQNYIHIRIQRTNLFLMRRIDSESHADIAITRA